MNDQMAPNQPSEIEGLTAQQRESLEVSLTSFASDLQRDPNSDWEKRFIVAYVNGLLAEKNAEIETLKARLRESMAANRQPDVMPAIFEPLDNPTPLNEIAIWWLNGHSDNEMIIGDGSIERLPEYIASEVHSLHGRPTRGRLWVPPEIRLNEIEWDDNKPRASECANRGGIVFWRKDIDLLKGLPGFVTDAQMNEISLQ